MAILDNAGDANNTISCQNPMGNPSAQAVRVEADTSSSPRRLLFKGMVTGTQDSAQVTYLGGCDDAQFDAHFVDRNNAVGFTGTYSGVTASYCQLGVDGVIVLLASVGSGYVAYASCRNPASMAR